MKKGDRVTYMVVSDETPEFIRGQLGSSLGDTQIFRMISEEDGRRYQFIGRWTQIAKDEVSFLVESDPVLVND